MSGSDTFVDKLGDPVAYTALKDGIPVYDPARTKIGVVEDVVATGGIFEGLIIHTHPLPGRHLYAAADQIAEIREHGVLLAADAGELPAPVVGARRQQASDRRNSFEALARRAWDWIVRRP